MSTPDPSARLGTILMIVSAASFGTMPYLATLSREGNVGTETLLFIRFGLSGLIVGLLALAQRRKFPRGASLRNWVILGLVLYTAQSYSFFTALLHAPGALVSLLLYLYPVIVAGLAVWLLHEKMTKLKVTALALAIFGAVLAVGPVASATPKGVAWGLAAACFYSVYLVAGAKLLEKSDGVAASVVIMASATVAYGTLATINGWQFPSNSAGWIGAIGLALSSAIALATLFAGMEIIGPVNASTLSAIEPIVTATLGFVLLHQKLTGLQIIGGLLILVAAVVVVRGVVPNDPHPHDSG